MLERAIASSETVNFEQINRQLSDFGSNSCRIGLKEREREKSRVLFEAPNIRIQSSERMKREQFRKYT